jgi:hypothetical protein
MMEVVGFGYTIPTTQAPRRIRSELVTLFYKHSTLPSSLTTHSAHVEILSFPFPFPSYLGTYSVAFKATGSQGFLEYVQRLRSTD